MADPISPPPANEPNGRVRAGVVGLGMMGLGIARSIDAAGFLTAVHDRRDAATVGAPELAPVWRDTVVVVATEFGRTVRMNGTAGSDHGTGSLALVVGGAVKGGRVVADWPGLAEVQLHEKRDLRPTTDLRALFKGLLADHLGLDAARLADTVFPGSAGVAPLGGLLL